MCAQFQLKLTKPNCGHPQLFGSVHIPCTENTFYSEVLQALWVCVCCECGSKSLLCAGETRSRTSPRVLCCACSVALGHSAPSSPTWEAGRAREALVQPGRARDLPLRQTRTQDCVSMGGGRRMCVCCRNGR